jgi:D-alanyl-D-alanine carboxypeptidase/D-alanyl-D-alanine-endopeptidase (penicillin-binding protein 4)
VSVTERFTTKVETNYLTKLALKGFRLDAQGLLIESIDGSTIYADHQSDVAFNPASVIKLATSFTALEKFGPDFQFETAFYAVGDIDKKTRTLKGDLFLQSTGDPVLSTADVNKLVRDVIRAGVARVTGNLIVCGPFTYASYSKTADGTKHLAATVKKMGIRVSGATSFRAVSGLGRQGIMLSSHSSDNLRNILFTQNARSVNNTAERVGEAVGGPKGVEAFLTGSVGIPPAEISISRTSGLDYNRITPRSTVHLLQVMMQWLAQRNMEPEDIMPVAGIDAGTLKSRFKSADYRGAIVGKTGTLPATDGGVSTLAGIMYTRDRGPILFAIFNTRGSVKAYRQLQDSLLQELIEESGGPQNNPALRRAGN